MWRRGSPSCGSIPCIKNLVQLIDAIFFVVQLQDSADNGANHTPQKGVCFNLKIDQIFLLPTPTFVNFTDWVDSFTAGALERREISFTDERSAGYVCTLQVNWFGEKIGIASQERRRVLHD